MATPPTFVSAVNSASWATGANKTVVQTVAIGDLVLSYAGAEDTTSTGDPSPSANVGAFSLINAANISGRGYTRTHKATASGNGSSTITVPGNGAYWGFGVLVVRDVDGTDPIGADSITYGISSPSHALPTITTEADNSAVLALVVDWSANSGLSRSWPTVNGYKPTAVNGGEIKFEEISSHYTMYAAYYPDVGAAGLKSFYNTGNPGQNMLTISMGGHHCNLIEIKSGTIVPPEPPPDPSPAKRANPGTLPYLLGQVPFETVDEEEFFFEGWGVPI